MDLPSPSPPPDAAEMENLITDAPIHDDPSSSSSLWNWSEIFDFAALDDGGQLFTPSVDSDPAQPESQLQESSAQSGSGRVRKRDPRATCSNFLAGRIPCACPEMDEKLEEEGLPGKKRSRVAARCQVPGCEADIGELKGYHRRHRVCLRCANARSVVLDGQRKRYCQQCGKFHILSDFDEGKRSCRRKLERHNNRRRRKPNESGVTVEREGQGHAPTEDVACDGENGKDGICFSSQIAEMETLMGSEGQVSTLCLNPGPQKSQSDSFVSLMASGEVQIDGDKDKSKHAYSSGDFVDKSAYSSKCPTGRISFKLYDWNPAEFPRRLRHQIFQWLDSMPVELEGYIRPGCTILTVFIAMPNFMWSKLLQDPALHIHDFVTAPQKMLSGRGTLLVYLDNLIFRVMGDGTSVMSVKVMEHTPKLHYVHPTCFEAGKPMEFVACGSNLIQPKFRFLVSFAGKYLEYDYSVLPLYGEMEGVTASLNHQLLKICIPHTETNLFGPAFVEVENESGISNFIPILIGNQDICSEMRIMEQSFVASPTLKGSKFLSDSTLFDSHEVSILEQSAFSQFILDIAWLLRKPALEDTSLILTSSQIERFNCLLIFLVHNKSISTLMRVLNFVETLMNNTKFPSLDNDIADTKMKLLRCNMDQARKTLCKRLQENGNSVQISRCLVPRQNCLYQSSQIDMLSVVSSIDQFQDKETTNTGSLDAVEVSNLGDHSCSVPLLNKDVARMNRMKGRPRNYCHRVFTNKFLTSRLLFYVIAAAAVCFGICEALLHPQNVSKIATTIGRCLLDNA
ncbi:squamosa promoter-binding-like protein 7 isoform X1 [Diospyros lotus]|uniref:squamosa promoter-binding-like protein 7 isoform X1 n=1 Tax=Diospyros lotus TaxID=55363 RepID=UPI00225291C2|nr:squamosa promoter-binding-like protein 7 isoform X1 [Diospyros lotus]